MCELPESVKHRFRVAYFSAYGSGSALKDLMPGQSRVRNTGRNIMTNKLQSCIQLAGQTAAQVTKNPRNWVKFLNTASRLYRYPFPDQLMLHAQRSQAAACASYEIWVTISYVLIKRCGLNPEQHFTLKDFQDITDFNTQKIIRILGGAVSGACEQVLRTIALAIYEFKHQARPEQQPAQTYGDGADQPSKLSVRQIYDRYKDIIRKLILEDDAYRNACQNSDKEESRCRWRWQFT